MLAKDRFVVLWAWGREVSPARALRCLPTALVVICTKLSLNYLNSNLTPGSKWMASCVASWHWTHHDCDFSNDDQHHRHQWRQGAHRLPKFTYRKCYAKWLFERSHRCPRGSSVTAAKPLLLFRSRHTNAIGYTSVIRDAVAVMTFVKSLVASYPCEGRSEPCQPTQGVVS